MPGDIFEIADIKYFSDGNGYGYIYFRREKGILRNQNICPMNASLMIKILKCELVKTEEGIPEGVNCEVFLQNLFNYMEEKNKTEEQTEELMERIKS